MPIERVHFGPGCIDGIGAELDRLGSQRPFVITGRSISSNTDLIDRIQKAAGRKLAGSFTAVRQHTPESSVKQAAKSAVDVKADSLISLGGGSPIDATKIVVKELSDNFRHGLPPHIAVPTTLSAAEFSHSAGMTDEILNRKTGFRDVRMVPRLIFLDPLLAIPTPAWLWASTGIRSLDHAVEAVDSAKHQPYVDTLALQAIHLLFQNLKRSMENPNDVESRQACQLAAWMSYAGALSVGTGISHAIGRVIGATWNIPHGITSCITLAEVMRVEAKRDPKKFMPIALAEGKKIEGIPEEAAAISAAEGVAELVEDLGLAKRLRDYNIEKSDLTTIAEAAGGRHQYQEILGILGKIW